MFLEDVGLLLEMLRGLRGLAFKSFKVRQQCFGLLRCLRFQRVGRVLYQRAILFVGDGENERSLSVLGILIFETEKKIKIRDLECLFMKSLPPGHQCPTLPH